LEKRAILYNIAIIFFGIFIEAFPFLMIGVIISSLITVFVKAETIGRFFPEGALRGIPAALVIGFAVPVCECGNIPVARGLLAKGAGPGPVITFLLAAPVFNPIVIIATVAAFPGRPEITWLRVGFTAIIAVVAGALFLGKTNEDVCREEFIRSLDGGVGHDPAKTAIETNGAEGSGGEKVTVRLLEAVFVARDELFYVTRFLAAGALIAALFRTVLPQRWILDLGQGPVWSIVAMIIMAFVVSMCSNVDAFFAAVFAETFTTGSLLAFLVFGPMIDVKAVSMLYSTLKVSAIVRLTLIVLVLTFLLSLAVNIL